MTTAATTRPTFAERFVHLPPVVCEPWCRDGSGHTDAHFPGDQWCSSEEEARVPLTREKLVEVESDPAW